MKNLLIALLCIMCGVCWGQQSDAEKYLRELSASYVQDSTKLAEGTLILEEIKAKIVPSNQDSKVLNELTQQIQETRKIQVRLDSVYTAAQTAMSFYIAKEKLKLEDLKLFFPHKHQMSTGDSTAQEETKLISYFGEGQTIDHDILKNKTGKEAEIIRTALMTVNKDHYLGDITIPQKGKEFYFYTFNKRRNAALLGKYITDKLRDTKKIGANDLLALASTISQKKQEIRKSGGYNLTEKIYKFNNLAIEVKDGYFYDIVAKVDDDAGNTHIFTNQVGQSVLFFSNYGDRKFMYYSHSEKKDGIRGYKDSELNNFYIKLTDIFSYSYDVGNHYIPLELQIKLPDDITDNNDSNVKYKIVQEAPLDKIVEMRVYSDFLALFGEAENGLVQVDGRATFYLFPYPFRLLGSKRVLGQIEYLPTLSPYVNYSRFEDTSRFASLEHIQENLFQPHKLNLIEKRFLTMGVEGEIFKWQHKGAPVKLSGYGFLNYNISELNIGTDEIRDVRGLKSMGYGGGLHLSTKRFNNFGFDYKVELSWFDYRNFNVFNDIATDFTVPVFKHEAEIFYHANGSPNSAIFVRLVTHNYKDTEFDDAFYQFQFGYKFAIGNRAVSK